MFKLRAMSSTKSNDNKTLTTFKMSTFPHVSKLHGTNSGFVQQLQNPNAQKEGNNVLY